MYFCFLYTIYIIDVLNGPKTYTSVIYARLYSLEARAQSEQVYSEVVTCTHTVVVG